MGCCLSIRKRRPQPEPMTSSTLIHGVQTPDSSDPHPECEGQEGNEETPAPGDQLQDVPTSAGSATHSNETEETIITNIRATDVTLGLKRVPAGFYVVVQHSGREWRTENKRVWTNNDAVEWDGPIPIPSDPSATVYLGIHASFEFQPVLGDGEQLRKLTITVEHLLNRSAEDLGFMFFPKDGDVVSPCSSLLVNVGRRKGERSDPSASRVLAPHCSTTESWGQVENATNEGHSALSRYRKDGEGRDLEHSIEQYQLALDICPSDHPYRAAAQSNIAMANLIQCLVDDSDLSLDVPLDLYRDALSARPVGHLDRPSTLIQLAAVHFARFEKRQDVIDKAQAEELLHEVMDLSSAESHENRAAILMLRLYTRHEVDPVQSGGGSSMEQEPSSGLTAEDPWTLGDHLLERFERFGFLEDLQHGISLLEGLVNSSSAWDDRYPGGLTNLGMALLRRFQRLGELSDLEQAISRLRKAVDLTPNGHPAKPGYQSNLGSSFQVRFQRLGELGDLEQAISMHRGAVHLAPDGRPGKASHLNNLGNSLFARFECLRKLGDLEEAISRFRDAVHFTPDGHPDEPGCLNNLGYSFLVRFQRLGELGDLEQAISRLEDALHLTPDGHPDKPGYLNNLANSFRARFQRLGELGDLEEAISRHRDAVHLTPDGHPDKPLYLNSLGISFAVRFERLGELGDVEQAISKIGDAVHLTPDGHPARSSRLINLGRSFAYRFERLGELGDIEQAISRFEDAVHLTPNGHHENSRVFNNLGNSYFARFEHLKELGDLEQAILRQGDAVDLTPDGHPDKPGYLHCLGNSFLARYDHLGEVCDLEQAFLRLENAVHLTPDGHQEKSVRLNSLGNYFRARFQRLGELGDLEQTISRLRDAVQLTPDGHPHKPTVLNNLGNAFKLRFERLRELGDLEQAISRQGSAVHLTPDGHSDKPALLNNLGNSFIARFRCLGELGALEQAISLCSDAACAPTGPTSVRFYASNRWIACARLLGHGSLFHAYSFAIDLLPQLAWIGLSLTDRYRALVQGADVVREAAAAALDSGRPELAVEWLEQGRSIVWGELFQLRSSYDELFAMHPDHARKLRELSDELEHASIARERSLSSAQERVKTLEQEANRHRALAIERDELLQVIRRLPGFERFLLRKEFTRLRASAHSGPVVILNAAKTRCDALIVLADMDNVVHVPLPNFTLARSESLQTSMKGLIREGKSTPQDNPSRWEPILSALWQCIVKPVLDSLAISTPEDLSRIFWCPTGPLTFLPIHAAGFYDTEYSQPGYKVFDFVVSSYVPTLSILVPPPVPDATSSGDLRFLTVLQPPSDGLAHLPGVHAELEHIKAVIQNSRSTRTALVESSLGTVEEVLDLMKGADWVHFACHGAQDGVDSGLCLANKRRLKIADIITLSRPRGGLAFLSACQTATGDKELSDEALHIAAGMLFAGYGGVVGTMWSISDKLAPYVARDVYERLFGKGTKPDYREAAQALQDALGGLRAGGASFWEWLPFIHVGL